MILTDGNESAARFLQDLIDEARRSEGQPTAQADASWEDANKAVREIFDSLPPKTWDVHVWDKKGAIPGRIDRTDAHRLITLILAELGLS